MPFNSELQAALSGAQVSLFFAVRMAHPVKTVHLLDGAGTLSFGGEVWSGFDPDFGALGALEAIGDQADRDEAPEFLLTVRPADAALLVGLATAAAQGCAASLYIGAFDPQSGAVVGTPEVVFQGEVDDVDMVLDGASSAVTFTLVSHFVRFQAEDEAITLSDSFHQSVWPGEKGLEFMTEVEQQMPWGAEGPRPAVVAVKGVTSLILGRGNRAV
ncbi:hypothetical protein ABI_21920 [Asticcacaulis biprosthecium C19]|uniref:Uncharacterized protein n=1 Tax=Asticcacaulis biprosthecium C19 TaxID=715226 RepID=F4QGZ7_9CAUL|nr:hypothetical protein [Asticcacaulis biprosthecium]EGF93750.1 hypothetical protein ABI_21920 [Asticcacaulis biprosthecium C19]